MPDNRIEQRLTHRGVKLTAMRLLVYEQLEQARQPLSLRELEDRMQTADRSTIFRTLALLQQHHIVHSIEDGSGVLKYEVCHGHDECTIDDQHTHFYCQRCHRTFCFHETRIPQVDLPEGFQMYSINYMVKGLCPKCAARLTSKAEG